MDDPKPLSDLISLKGKTALITGSAAGIGRAIAYRLAEAGADLELVDVDEGGLRETETELSALRSKIGTHRIDLSEKEEIDALWETLKGREPDVLVNNAGTYPFKKFVEIDEAFLKSTMDINLNSALWMCQHMMRGRSKSGGVIINIASIEAILPFKSDLVPYDVSKMGVIALTRALAKEYGKAGFRINVILPGGITTPGTRQVAKRISKLEIGLIKSGIEFMWRLPMGRFGDPDEVARVALFLACDLSSYMNGALVAVDGGFLSS